MGESRSLLQKVRSQLKLTQTEMAERLRVKQTTISQYEAGKTEPSIEVLMRAARLVESHADLYQAIALRIASRVRSLTDEEQFDLLPIVISDHDEPFDRVVGAIIAELKNACNVPCAPGVIKMLQLYRKTQNTPALWPSFAKAADYIEVEITRRPSQPDVPKEEKGRQVRPTPKRRKSTRHI